MAYPVANRTRKKGIPQAMAWTGKAVVWAAVFSLLGVPAGCGPKRPKTVPVTGRITYRGQPLEGARVMFYTPGGRPATGTTDKDGRFRLETFSTSDGALLGEHTVVISKYVSPLGGDPLAPGQEKLWEGGPPPIRQLIPARYTTPAASPLRAKVTAEGPNDFSFDLTD